MEELKTEFVQERNSGARKGFFYDREKGGYVPAKVKPVTGLERNERRNRLIILIAIGVIGILVYIFRNKLKNLWLQKTKEVLSSGGS